MDVSVLSGTSRAEGFGNVGDVDVNQAGCASGVARLGADGNGVAKLFVLERVDVSEMTCIDRKS
jgi:hypothetical protein